MVTSILRHFGFADCIVNFFFNYLVDKSTQYSWNFFLFNAYDIDIDMEQDYTLFSILSMLYIVSLIYIFEIRAQAFNLSTSILLFVDNGLLISQEEIYNTIIPELYSSYSREYNNSNHELDLSAISAPTLKPKTYWKYLGFYFNQCLFFKKHVYYYFIKSLSLGNSTRGLFPL